MAVILWIIVCLIFPLLIPFVVVGALIYLCCK